MPKMACSFESKGSHGNSPGCAERLILLGILLLFTSPFHPICLVLQARAGKGLVQANKPACHTAPGLPAEDKKHPCQTQRTLLLPAHVAPCLSCCCCPPSPMEVMWSSPGGRCTHSGFASQLRNPWRIFIMDYKLTCTNFCLQRRHYIY